MWHFKHRSLLHFPSGPVRPRFCHSYAGKDRFRHSLAASGYRIPQNRSRSLYRRKESPHPGTNPPKYHTRFDGFLDTHIQQYIDQLMKKDNVAFAVPVDRNGYLPTHTSKYSLPLTGDQKDRIGNRTKRIFNDPPGLAAARYDGSDGKKTLVQGYRRDTGETMMDCAAPISIGGRQWGAFRVVGMEVR